MKPSWIPFIAGVLAFAAPLLSGCAEEEEAEPGAAYPRPVGVTSPNDRALPGTAGARTPVIPPPPPPYPGESGPDSAPEVVVDDSDPGAVNPSADGYADADPGAVTDFRPALDPYGTWVDDPTYGTVWVPSASAVGPDFTPYASDGHWAYDDDYTWISDYSWGWAPFHYGRWVTVGPRWGWIPGRAYAGAWVSWRYGDAGYVGWGPLAPTWGWRGGAAFRLAVAPSTTYAYVRTGDLFAPAVHSRLVTGAQVSVVAAGTRPWVAGGPGVGTRALGPPPARLNIAPSAVVGVEGRSESVVRARAFARPSTAVAFGAHSPQVQASPIFAVRGTQSHFGGRMGVGFAGSAPASRPVIPYYASPRPWGSGGAPTAASVHAAGAGVVTAPRAAPQGSPSPGAAVFHGGVGAPFSNSPAPSGGSSHGGGGAAPSGGSPAPSGGSFHGGGGGGWHGGGGGGWHGGGGGGGHGGRR